jgi:hypothetical protein
MENQSGYPPLGEGESLAGKLFQINGLN